MDVSEDYEQYYAVSHDGPPPRRFKLLKRTKAVVSIPYSLLPIIILDDEQNLIIKAYELRIFIEGRNLSPLEKALSEEVVLWISESNSQKDSGESQVFIRNISIQGDAIEGV